MGTVIGHDYIRSDAFERVECTLGETTMTIDTLPLAHSVESAARRLGIGRTTVFQLIREGRLPARKVGSRTLIRETDLAAFIASAPVSR